MNAQSAPTIQNRPYAGFDGQFVNGSWRPGRQGGTLKDTDPYTGDTLAVIAMANQSDLDEAYRSAARAQAAWAASPPSERESVIYRAATIMEARHQEVLDWLIRESGSTRIKAEMEWQYTRSVTLEAATFPRRVEGRPRRKPTSKAIRSTSTSSHPRSVPCQPKPETRRVISHAALAQHQGTCGNHRRDGLQPGRPSV